MLTLIPKYLLMGNLHISDILCIDLLAETGQPTHLGHQEVSR